MEVFWAVSHTIFNTIGIFSVIYQICTFIYGHSKFLDVKLMSQMHNDFHSLTFEGQKLGSKECAEIFVRWWEKVSDEEMSFYSS